MNPTIIIMNDLESKLQELREKYQRANLQDRPIIIRQAKALQIAIELKKTASNPIRN